MRPTHVSQLLKALIPTKRPLYLWGAPGIAKSSLVKQAAESLKLQCLDLRAVLLDPVDLRGLPKLNGDNTAHWCPPAFLPRDGEGVLFLDELAQAPPLVQASCLSLTLDRRIGEYQLPDDWTVIAASNRQEDRAGAHKLITPLLNRFIHIDLEVSNEDWNTWAALNNIAVEVRMFLLFKPALLFDFKPSSGDRAFPTPRSWQFLSDVLAATPAELMSYVASGCVGEGPGAEFTAFCKIYRDLPSVDDILANPTKFKVPTEPSVLYALCGAMAERSKDADAKTIAKLVQFASRMPQDLTVCFMSQGCQVNAATKPNRFVNANEVKEWCRLNRAVFLSAFDGK